MLDEIVVHIKDEDDAADVVLDAEGKPVPKFAIIGQPNAGKSTLLNALVSQERTIVSDVAGTTRDTIHTHYKLFGKEFVLIDTAGIRKKKNVHEDLEFYSVIRAIRAMDEADVCMLLIDAQNGVTAQDVSIFSLATRKGKGIVLLVNKWDLVENKQTNTARDVEKEIKEKLQPFTDVPIIFVSALEKTRIFQAMEKALEVNENRHRRITTSVLNEVMLKEIERYPPPMARGYNVTIKFVQQVPTAVPSFAFFSNHPDSVKEPYKNFLENKIRTHFNFSGVPVRIFLRKK
jgi:GTP-binding protein